jgi:hypothetical protein
MEGQTRGQIHGQIQGQIQGQILGSDPFQPPGPRPQTALVLVEPLP